MTLKHVHRFKDRHGRERCYLRLPGLPAVALPGLPGSPEFMGAYNEAVAAHKASGKASAVKAYTFRDLAARYWQTARFKGKSDRTRYVERNAIERFLREHGDKDARGMQTRHLDRMVADMADRPAAAMDMLKRLRLLFTLAIKLGWRRDDPTREADRLKLGTHHTWTEDEIAVFHARWPRGTVQRTAMDLLLYTGQRSGDVRRMTWADVKDGRVKVLAQEKTAQPVSAKLHPELAATLAAHERKGVVILINALGKPWTEKGFGNEMADAIERAGLPERCVAHGLRKAAARRLAEAGCTAHEIMSVTGHRSIKDLQRYTEEAARAVMADSAMDKISGTKVETRRANLVANPEKG